MLRGRDAAAPLNACAKMWCRCATRNTSPVPQGGHRRTSGLGGHEVLAGESSQSTRPGQLYVHFYFSFIQLVAMDPVHRRVLANKTTRIMNRITSPTVFSAYLSPIFTSSDMEEIRAGENTHGATHGTQTMLSLLEKRGPKAFDLFMTALEDPGNQMGDLADELKEEDRKLRGRTGKLLPLPLVVFAAYLRPRPHYDGYICKFENTVFTLKTQQKFSIHTGKRIKCFFHPHYNDHRWQRRFSAPVITLASCYFPPSSHL